ncbi:MAG: helix-turn-helix transcriptional regulator [Gammaproteobacteria bacterium]|nr:helix-turn-helix transcriptional regulator [Gammaproteobacteria bacterium]
MMNNELITKRLGALAHPARLTIVRMLVRVGPSGLPAGKLGAAMDIAPNALTFHLQKLANVSLVSSRREGQYVVYTADFTNLLGLVEHIVGACCVDTAEKCGPRCSPSTRSPLNTASSLKSTSKRSSK